MNAVLRDRTYKKIKFVWHPPIGKQAYGRWECPGLASPIYYIDSAHQVTLPFYSLTNTHLPAQRDWFRTFQAAAREALRRRREYINQCRRTVAAYDAGLRREQLDISAKG